MSTDTDQDQARALNELVSATSNMKVSERAKNFLPVATTALAATDDDTRAPAAWVVSAHGGAGATTLAHLFAPFGDAGKQWPAADENPWCVVAARTTRSGIDAAEQAVLQAQAGHAGGCTVLGVVLVADAPGKLPKLLAHRVGLLEQLTTVWNVTYFPEVRETFVDKLATWSPGADEEPTTKRQRKEPPITEAIPTQVATVGTEIFHAAYAAHQELKETKS